MSMWPFVVPYVFCLIVISEVVLSVLLGSFHFSPSKKDITWKMTGIAGPYVEGENEGRPQLPIVMRLVD